MCSSKKLCENDDYCMGGMGNQFFNYFWQRNQTADRLGSKKAFLEKKKIIIIYLNRVNNFRLRNEKKKTVKWNN